MKKVIFILLLFSSFVTSAQVGTFDFLNARKRLTLGSWYVTDFKNDTFNWNVSGARYLPTSKAVYDFVTARIALVPGGGGGSMVYPPSGIPTSTGSAWGTSIVDFSSNWNAAYSWGNHAGLYPLLSSFRDSLNLKLYKTDTLIMLNPYVKTPGGTAGLIPRWIDSRTMGNSSILYDNGTNAGATATFLAPSMKSSSSPHYYSFRVDGNLGMGEVFSDGSYIQRLLLANYHYIQSVSTPSNGFYVGAYINGSNNSSMLFKPVGKRVMFNTTTDSSHQYVFNGTSFKSNADTITFPNVPTASQAYVLMSNADGRLYKQDTTGLFGGNSFYPTSVSYNQATKTLSIARNGTGDITTTLPDATTSLSGLMLAVDKWFIDSLRAGQIADSVYYSLKIGPTTHDSAYVYVNAYGTASVDSTFMFLVPKYSGGVGGSGILSLGTSAYGLTIQNDSTYKADTIQLSTRLWRQKGIDSVQANINLKVNISDTASMLSGYVRTQRFLDSLGTGSGTTYKIGTLNGATPDGNGAVIVSDSIYMQTFSSEMAGLVPSGGTVEKTLRGDGTWGVAPKWYKVTSDVASPASTAYSDITGLSFTATSGVTYVIDAVISVKVDATTTGAKFAINGPASPTFVSTSYFYATTSSALGINNHSTYDAASATTGTATLSTPLWFRATIKTSSTGTVALRFGSEIATAASVTINAGSYMSVMSSN